MLIILIASIISNSIVLNQNKKYETIYNNLDGKEIELQGKIISKENEKFKITSIKYKNIYFYLNCKENLEYGDEIKISGKFEAPNKATNYKGFNYRSYLKTLKIAGTIKSKKIEIIKKGSLNSFLLWINEISILAKKKIENFNLNQDEKAILEGILLGDKSNIEDNIIDSFSESNMSHILAISGMHISYIILILSIFFNKVVGKHLSKIITSMFVIIYMLLTKFPLTLVRAGVSGIILIMSNFFYRKNDIFQSISLSLLIILIYNPYAILNIGLQLSYFAIIGIVFFEKTLKKLNTEYLERTRNRAIRKNKKILKNFLNILNSKIGSLILDSILLTFSCTITLIPILVYHFNIIPIFSLIFSILSGFIIGPIIIIGLICLIFNFFFFEKILSLSLKILIFLSGLGSKIPLNNVYVITPSIFFIIFYYLFSFLYLFLIKVKSEKKPNTFQMRVRNICSLIKYKLNQNKKKVISIIIIISLIFTIVIIFPKDLRIYFVDVGQRRLHSYFNS